MEKLYLLALLPPADLRDQVAEIRKTCATDFQTRAALQLEVHVPLFRVFKMNEKLEPYLQKKLALLRHLPPFPVLIRHFDSFNAHTLYLRVQKSPELAMLNRSIGKTMTSFGLEADESGGKATLFVPHITIAYRDIAPDIFPAMWEEYKNKKFSREFEADRFVLLKRSARTWEERMEFRLRPKVEVLTLF